MGCPALLLGSGVSKGFMEEVGPDKECILLGRAAERQGYSNQKGAAPTEVRGWKAGWCAGNCTWLM